MRYIQYACNSIYRGIAAKMLSVDCDRLRILQFGQKQYNFKRKIKVCSPGTLFIVSYPSETFQWQIIASEPNWVDAVTLYCLRPVRDMSS